MRVVDLCSGDGYFTASMAELVAGSTVLAVELSEELIAAARAEMERAGGPREAARPAVRAAFLAGQVAAWVEPAGFRLREVKEVGPYHYGAIFDAVRGKD
jgi:predicted RNA methylase